MDAINLSTANNDSLVITNVNEGWLRLTFSCDGQLTILGAADPGYIKDHLLNFLNGVVKEEHLVDDQVGKSVWIMTLSENHYAVYGCYPLQSGMREIFFIEDGGATRHLIKLYQEHIDAWIGALEHL